MLDRDRFNEQFQRFRSLIPAYDDGRPFTNFNTGVVHRWEGYKLGLRDSALDILGPKTWKESEIGSGTILERTIGAVEINGNDLIVSPPSWGAGSSGHRVLLDVRGNAKRQVELERHLFGLFADATDDATTFDGLKKLLGAKYPLLGYLFFLKDMDRFMPIRPKFVDHAFHELGIDLITSYRGSWENYQRFNAALSDVRNALAEMDGLTDVRLIDAHSFCLISVRKLKFDRDKAIERMLDSVKKGAGQARGQTVEHAVKNKDLRMNPEELNELLESLLERQRNRCALTGIPFDESNQDLRPSVDRIDSDGHYEQDNLQIVCRFVNFWKRDKENDEFRRLLMLVRHEDSFPV